MSIFDHISINVSDFERSRTFYQSSLHALGIDQRFATPRPDGSVAGFGRERVSFLLFSRRKPRDTSHIAFAARSRAEVDAFHAGALSSGGRDNGAPGLRPHYHRDYYAAFVLDPDGNNIEAVFQGRL